MRKAIFFLAVLCVLCNIIPCFALEWKRLHEEADKKNLQEAQAYVTENAGSIDAQYVLGLACLNLHKDTEAERIFKNILNQHSDVVEAKWGLAEVLRRQHKLGQSEKLLLEVIKDNPAFSPSYISLAYLKYTQMDFEKTVALASSVLQHGKDTVDLSNYTRAYLLLAAGKGMIAHYGGPLSKVINGTAVLPNLKKAEQLQPDSPGVLFGLGSFYFLAPVIAGGNRGKALEYLERAIKIDPLFADAYVRLAQLYKMKGNNEKYEEYIQKVKEIDPQNTILLDMQSKQCKFICISLEK